MMVKEIPLTQGKFALVDDDNYEWLSKFKWYAHKSKKLFYAGHKFKRADKSQYDVKMHRLILPIPSGFECDHIDGNGLNNQRSNLRVVTHRQNQQNLHSVRSSKFFGVHKDRNHWKSSIQIGGIIYHLGMFDWEEEAHQAYLNALPVSGYP